MKRILVLAVCVGALLAGTQGARAETIYLKCGNFNVWAFDLTGHTANGYPAQITPISIDWDQTSQGLTIHYHIDRSTGILMASGFMDFTDPCTKVDAPSTKF